MNGIHLEVRQGLNPCIADVVFHNQEKSKEGDEEEEGFWEGQDGLWFIGL